MKQCLDQRQRSAREDHHGKERQHDHAQEHSDFFRAGDPCFGWFRDFRSDYGVCVTLSSDCARSSNPETFNRTARIPTENAVNRTSPQLRHPCAPRSANQCTDIFASTPLRVRYAA